MAVTIQSGSFSQTGSLETVTVSSYVLANSILVHTMNVDGNDNAWDGQIIARKVSTTSISFQRRGNTGSMNVQWWLIEADDGEWTVQDIDDGGPFGGASSPFFNDHTITTVDLSRSFPIMSVRDSGDRDGTSHGRVRLTSTTNVRVEQNEAASADHEYFVQVVELATGIGASVQEVLFSDDADIDQAITTVDPSKTLLFGSAYGSPGGTADILNEDLYRMRLNGAGTQLQLRRVNQNTGVVLTGAAYIVEADIFSVQHASVTILDTDASEDQAFTAPSDTTQAFPLMGSFYDLCHSSTNGGSTVDSSVFRLTMNGAFTTMTCAREVTETLGDAFLEVMLVEIVVPSEGTVQPALLQFHW